MKPRQFIHALSLLGIGLALSVISSKVMAAPFCPSPSQWTMTPPGVVEINPDAALNTVLWEGRVEGTLVSGGPCIEARYVIDMLSTRPFLGNGTYDSGILGIGMRIKIDSMCGSAYWPMRCSGNWIWLSGHGADYLDIELVKVGPITAGGKLSGYIGEWRANNNPADQFAIYTWGGSVEVTPQKPTCSVSSTSIDVPLGNFFPKEFAGIGSTTAEQSFNIALHCSGGYAGTVLKVHTTLTDARDEANTSNVLSLSQDSEATGVGIQILSDTTVLNLGPNAQWHAGNVQHGESTFTIPLSARYVQTAREITPGTANGNATFTMSYQ